jgi:hypothetical protein
VSLLRRGRDCGEGQLGGVAELTAACVSGHVS